MRILTAVFAVATDFLPFSVVAAADRAKASEIGRTPKRRFTSKNLFVAERFGDG
jgi:hypothetical protein